MNQTEELSDTFLEEYSGAGDEFQKSRFKNSIILYSKALFALADFILFKRFEKLPKNHSERFNILRKTDQKLYEILDQTWSEYTDSYSKPVNN